MLHASRRRYEALPGCCVQAEQHYLLSLRVQALPAHHSSVQRFKEAPVRGSREPGRCAVAVRHSLQVPHMQGGAASAVALPEPGLLTIL